MKAVFACLLALVAAPAWAGTPSLSIKLDHFGYRPGDSKVAIFTANPGAAVQVRNLGDAVVYTVPTDGGSISSQGADAHSGDTVWWVDFSGFATPGSYRLYSASLGAQSYDFDIREDVYNQVGLAALKIYYYQRCGTPKPAAHAGAAWADANACHLGDAACTAHAGHTNHGTRDLSGGWHDAGDHNKYAWYAVTDSVYFMLRAYEDNPGVFTDNQLNIPESGNGRPDILDEIKWELDWLLKMQLPDGSVLDRVRAADGVYTVWAPPSVDTTTRFYKNPTHESAATLAVSCAIGARIFEARGETAYAATLRNAANAAWAWLGPRTVSVAEARYKVFAAAEVFRTDPTQTGARAYVDGYTTWNTFFFNMDTFDSWAAHTYIRTPAATPAVVNAMRTGINAAVNGIFANDDKYLSGMVDWYYYWGSNRPRAKHGLFLLHAVSQGLTGSRTAAQVREKARGYLHYFHGRNPLSMVYLTNMAALGGEHSSWMFYHGWFGDSNNTYSRTRHLGKPSGVSEPHYPYFAGTDNHGVNDNRSSTYGPPPGYVPGGVNFSYSGSSIPPAGSTHRNKAYRDWAWQSAGTAPNTWEITENSISSQGPYVALAAYFMQPSVVYTPTPSPTASPPYSATPSPTPTVTACAVPLNMAESLAENGTWSGANATRSIVAAGSAPAGAVTQGSGALRVQVITGATWNDAIVNLQGFLPNVFQGATHLSLDLHVSASLAGSAYNSLFLYGSCGACPGGKWYRQMAAPVALVAGANQVRFVLDYSLDTQPNPLQPNDPISQILLIHNRESAATGDFYLDNMRLEGLCWTPTPTRSPTATATPTRTATSSHTPSPSFSPTPSPQDSPTATPSATAPPPGSSPTDTPTVSPTATDTPTATPTSSPEDSPTATPSATAPPPGSSPTDTPLPSATATATPPLPTETATPAAPTPTPTAGGPPATATATPASPSASSGSDGTLVIERLTAFPQPDPRWMLVDLRGRAESLTLRFYSPAKVLLAELEAGPGGPGWMRVDLGPVLPVLPRGLSYVAVSARRGEVRSQTAKAPLVRLP